MQRSLEGPLKRTLDGAPNGIAVVDLVGRFVRANQALCAMLGRTEADLLNLSFQDITHPDDLDPDRALVARLLVGEIDLAPENVMQATCEHAQSLTGATSAVIQLREGDETVYAAAVGSAVRCCAATSTGEVLRLAERLLGTLPAAAAEVGVGETVGISIGVAVTDGTASAQVLLQTADSATFSAKRSGGNRHVVRLLP